jgi:hypothetical protein
MNTRRFLPFLLLTVAALFVAATAEAQCETCTAPCPDFVECSGMMGPGGYSGCMNAGDCQGCMGWICDERPDPNESAELEPFNQQYVLMAVTIENRARTKTDAMLAEKRRPRNDRIE